MKYILFIGDGMADDALEALGGRTPLQAAQKPTVDALAARGVMGHVCNCPKPLPAGSETAILSIFGCDPRQYFTGRSPMEAAASGIELRPGQVCYRCNLIAVEDKDGPLAEKKLLSHSAGSIDGPSAMEVVEILERDPRFCAAQERAGLVIHRFPAFRQLAVQSGVDIAGLVTIPPHDHLGETAGQHFPSGCANAGTLLELMELAHDILSDHPINQKRRAAGKLPANAIWFWAQGSAVALPSFQTQYGRGGGVISAVPLCHGIGALRGLEMIFVAGATGELDTNFEGKLEAARELLRREDFVCIHVEAPDECTHNGDLPGKIQAIEWLDSRLLKPLLAGLEQEGTDYRILLLSDHRTLTATRGHDGGDVPFLLYDSREDSGSGAVYDEAHGAAGECCEGGWLLLEMLFSK